MDTIPKQTHLSAGHFLSDLAERLESGIEKLTQPRFWPAIVGAIALIISWTSKLPDYFQFTNFGSRLDSRFFHWQSLHPLTPNTKYLAPLSTYKEDDGRRASHLYKTSYRLTLPLLSRVTKLDYWAWVVLPGICGLLFFPLIAQMAANISGDKVAATLFCWSYAACSAGHLFFGDFWLLYGDGVAYLLIAIAARSTNQITVFASLAAAAFTDERGAMAGMLVYFFHSCRNSELKSWRISHLWSPTPAMLAAAAACLFYAIVRTVLHIFTGIENDQSAIFTVDVILHHLRENIPGALFGTFEALWILPIVALAAAVAVRNAQWASCLIVLLCLFLASGFAVLDLERSLAYMFPLFFCCIWAIARDPSAQIRRLMLCVCLLNCLWCFVHRSALFGLYLLLRPGQ